MMVPSWLLVGIANFVFIFLKAFQQRNVMGLHYWWVMPTSLCMATAEVFVIGQVAISAVAAGAAFWTLWPFLLAVALGGGLGAVCSMWIHNRYIGRKKDHADIHTEMRDVPARVGAIATLRRRSGTLPQVQPQEGKDAS